jgi:nucleoside-diphosphate-sugar epimerase
MNVLLTGGTGFIGQALVKRLVDEGHAVRCLVRNRLRAEKLLGTKSIDYIVGDITDKRSLNHICDGVSVVYHLAAIMGHDSPSDEAFRKFRKINTEGTRNVAHACLGKEIEKFIYLSSTAAMGMLKEKIVSEDTLCKPYTPYQVSKYEGELVVKELTMEHGLPGIILRPCMVYGPGFKGDFLTIGRVVKTGFFPRIGFGKNLSPALYINDLADCLSLAKEMATVGETYLISSEESYALDQVVKIIAENLGVKLHIVFVPKFLALLGAWALERLFRQLGKKPVVTSRNLLSATIDRVLDITKAKRELRFKQHISIEEGLKRTVQYFKSVGYL